MPSSAEKGVMFTDSLQIEAGAVATPFIPSDANLASGQAIWGGAPDASISQFVGTAPIIDGDCSLRVAASANASTGTIISVGQRVPSLVGQVWSAGVWAGFSSPGMHARLSLSFQNAGGADLGLGGLLLGPTTLLGPGSLLGSPSSGEDTDGRAGAVTPELLRMEKQIAPFGTAFVAVRLSLVAVEPVTGSTTFDNLLLVKDEVVPEHPIDGDRGGMKWLGAKYFSPSQELEEDPLLEEWKSWTPPYLWAPEAVSRNLPG
jgi:hypothetical protein